MARKTKQSATKRAAGGARKAPTRTRAKRVRAERIGATPAPVPEVVAAGTVRASEAKPDWYRSRRGRLLRIVPIAKAGKRWGVPPDAAAVAYRSVPEKAGDAEVRGWLAAEYPLIPAAAPTKRPGEGVAKTTARPGRAGGLGRDLAPGTVLKHRSRDGTEVTAKVVSGGFASGGTTHPSLSAIARLHGARNAGLFFGLRRQGGGADKAVQA